MEITLREQRELIDAYERGEVVECSLPRSDQWMALKSKEEMIESKGCDYQFDFKNLRYRIKPETKRWRAADGEKVYYINELFRVNFFYEKRHICIGDVYYNVGNYFRTEEQAKAAAKLLKERLMREAIKCATEND